MRKEYVRVPVGTLHDAIATFVRETVHRCGGNISAAARQLGVTHQTVTNRLGGKAYQSVRRGRAA